MSRSSCRTCSATCCCWRSPGSRGWFTDRELTARGQRVHLVPDPRGGQAVRRHLHDHHPGARHPARPASDGALAAVIERGHRRRGPAGRRHVLLGSPASCRASSTTRRPTWRSSTPPAATPAGPDRARSPRARCWRSRPARCSWAPTPTSATRPTSWSSRSPRSAGVPHAELLRLHDLVGPDPAADLRPGHLAVFPLTDPAGRRKAPASVMHEQRAGTGRQQALGGRAEEQVVDQPMA